MADQAFLDHTLCAGNRTLDLEIHYPPHVAQLLFLQRRMIAQLAFMGNLKWSSARKA